MIALRGQPTNLFVRGKISDSGAVLGAIGFSDGGAGYAVLQSGSSPVELSQDVDDFLADDTWVECPGTRDVKCFRYALDGGVVEAIPIFEVYDLTLSGWVAGRDIGFATNTYLVLAPDGGRWAYPVSWGAVGAFNEHGVGVGQFAAPPRRLMIWRDGKTSSPPLPGPATSDWGADINLGGMIGGERFIRGLNRAAVFWDAEVVDLPLRIGDSSEVFAVNDNNIAVGVEWKSGDFYDKELGFVWGKGQYYLLNELLPDAGCTVLRAMDINNSNQIVARAICGAESPRVVRIDLK